GQRGFGPTAVRGRLQPIDRRRRARVVGHARRTMSAAGDRWRPMMDDLSHDDLARLLQSAGRRSPVPADRTARVKAAVHQAWADAGRVRIRRRVAFAVASALAAAAAVAVAVRSLEPEVRLPEAARAPIARIAAVVGTVSVNGSPLRAGDEIV